MIKAITGSQYSPAFSLVELLTAIALLGILLGFAVPSFSNFLTKNRSITAVNQIVMALNYARSAAIKRDHRISFCASSNQRTCEGSWSAGRIIVDDVNKQVLRVYPHLTQGATLSWRGSLGNQQAIQFVPGGFTAGQNGTFYYSEQLGSNRVEHKIIINRAGRIRVESQ